MRGFFWRDSDVYQKRTRLGQVRKKGPLIRRHLYQSSSIFTSRNGQAAFPRDDHYSPHEKVRTLRAKGTTPSFSLFFFLSVPLFKIVFCEVFIFCANVTFSCCIIFALLNFEIEIKSRKVERV